MIQLKLNRHSKNKFMSVIVPRFLLGITASTLVLSLAISSNAIAADDSDGDGLSDQYENLIGTEAFLADTDGDGINDKIEVGQNLKQPQDSDGDKTIDALDFDDDNDGLPTILENALDTDKDGLANYIDTDSDNDGVNDGIEGGMLGKDENFDMVDDAFDSQHEGSVDANGDYVNDLFKLPDYNNDGTPDYLDKNLQIATQKEPSKTAQEKIVTEIIKKELEIVKAKPKEDLKEVAEINQTVITQEKDKKKVKTVTIKVPKKRVVLNQHTDTDNDGLLDSQEKIIGINPLKRDSDGDKVSDAIEIGIDINNPQDTDDDGIIDALDVDDDNDGILTKNEDVNNDSSPINDDTDENGIPNFLDNDDDGDSRLTIAEGTFLDSDKDGILDFLDKNDGVKNAVVDVIKKEVIPDTPEVVEIDEEKPAQTTELEITDENLLNFTPEFEVRLEKESVPEVGSKILAEVTISQMSKESIVVNALEKNESVLPKTVVIKDDIKEVKKSEVGMISWLTSLLPN